MLPAVSQRRGFSLAELLIVIAIMATIAALTLGAAAKSMEWVYRSNTERTIVKVHEKLAHRLSAIAQEARSREPTPMCFVLAGGTSDRERRRARVILHKYLYKWSFPMNFQEIEQNYSESKRVAHLGGSGYPVAAALRKQLASRLTASARHNRETEPGACLFLVFSLLANEDTLTTNEVRDTDGDGVPEIVDAWGRPLRLYRWPVQYPGIAAAFPAKASTDAEDPEGLLYDESWQRASYNDPELNTTLPHPKGFAARFHTLSEPPQPPRYAPLTIVSAGPDGQFGLLPRFDQQFDETIPFDQLNAMMLDPDPIKAQYERDNIYSFRMKLAINTQ